MYSYLYIYIYILIYLYIYIYVYIVYVPLPGRLVGFAVESFRAELLRQGYKSLGNNRYNKYINLLEIMCAFFGQGYEYHSSAEFCCWLYIYIYIYIYMTNIYISKKNLLFSRIPFGDHPLELTQGLLVGKLLVGGLGVHIVL